jgi:hypothetical protein
VSALSFGSYVPVLNIYFFCLFFPSSNLTKLNALTTVLRTLLYRVVISDRPYVTLYDAIYKKGSNQIWVSMLLLSIFFSMELAHVSKNR